MTGARIKQAKEFIGNETFMLTYGDGVADINLEELLAFHKAHGKVCTMSSTQPEGRFGSLEIGKDARINKFTEKPKGDGSWINIGFFVCEPEVLEYIDQGSHVVFEKEPLENLAKDGELFTYQHEGFWKCMDTLRDKKQLEQLWIEDPKWKVWR